jgi:hypothetical protein
VPVPTPIATSYIAKLAFQFMKMKGISSFGDDSDEAQDAALNFDIAMKMCLEECDWHFASKYANLPEAVADFVVRLQEVIPEYLRFQIDGRELRCDQATNVMIRYTALITNESLLPTTFQVMVARQMAVLMGPFWTQSEKLTKENSDALVLEGLKAKRADRNSASARRYDGREDQPDWATAAVR